MAHAVVDAVEGLRQALDRCRDAAMYSLSDTEVVDLLGQVGEFADRLEGQVLVPLVAEVSGRALHKTLGAATPRHVVEQKLRCHPARAGMLVKVADTTVNGSGFEPTGQALVAGEISAEHAKQVIDAVRRLPVGECGPAEKAKAQDTMLGIAREASPKIVQQAAPTMFALVAPEAADEDQARREERERRRSEEARWLTFHGAGLPGVSELRVRIESALMDRLRALLDPLAAPRPIEATGTDTPDTRCHERRGGDAFAELVEALAAGNLADQTGESNDDSHNGDTAGEMGPPDQFDDTEGESGAPRTVTTTSAGHASTPAATKDEEGELSEAELARLARRRIALNPKRATFLIRLDYDPIKERLSSGQLDTGQVLDPITLARWACEANLVPIWCADGLVPLVVGNTHRFYDGKQIQALQARDGGCVFAGCDRPPRYCHAHHIEAFRASGRTSLDNGVLLCHFHHKLVHEGAWAVRLAADGIPETIPPPWIDPDRRPRRHLRFEQHTRRRC